MSRYVTVHMTLAQAYAAMNASDLIRDQYEAGGQRGEAAVYRRATERIQRAIDGGNDIFADLFRKSGRRG